MPTATHRNRLMPQIASEKQIPGKNARAVFSRRKQNAVDDDDDVDYPGRAPSITSESVSVAVSDSVSVSFALAATHSSQRIRFNESLDRHMHA